MGIQKTYGIVPNGELTCVWMDAGVVDYKLCDKMFQCEDCPFDTLIRRRLHAAGRQHTATTQRTAELKPNGEITMNAYFEDKLSALLQQFSTTELPSDRMYSKNHLWFKQFGPNSYRVGIDHLMLSLIESISGIAFVRVPASIKPNEPCAWIEHEGNTLPLKMPLAVTITNANVRVRETPRLLKQHPYDNGWILHLKPDMTFSATDTLVPSSDASTVYRQQAAEFQNDCQVALKEKQSRVGATLYDGGTPLETIEDIVGSRRYLEILTQRFLRL